MSHFSLIPSTKLEDYMIHVSAPLMAVTTLLISSVSVAVSQLPDLSMG
jgi:hypothetical protein